MSHAADRFWHATNLLEVFLSASFVSLSVPDVLFLKSEQTNIHSVCSHLQKLWGKKKNKDPKPENC